MGVQTHTMADITSPVAAARLFKALALDNHEILPKAAPEFVKSIEVVEGEANTVGCIKQINFPEGRPFKFVKNRADEINYDNLYSKYTSIEGDVLDGRLEYSVHENKYEPSGTGCHYTMIAHYHPKGDYVMKEEEIAGGKESIKKMFKAVEEYLIANPNVCN